MFFVFDQALTFVAEMPWQLFLAITFLTITVEVPRYMLGFVAALIARCDTLTADEVSRLNAAWDVARDAARDGARVVARDAAWDATWDATRDTAWGAAWGITWDAAWALLLRDLIGQCPGWDQDAYDLLTGPWRQTIGPIHPDDAPMAGSS